MARLDPRFNTLDTSNTFNEVMFDRTNKSMNASKYIQDPKSAMTNNYDTENTKKFQVSFNMGPNNNKSLLAQYKSQAGNDDENKSEQCEQDQPKLDNQTMNEQSHQIQKQYINDTQTPLYTKNPNMTNNKIGEILEISKGESDLIEPSPSGITRCFVKFDETTHLLRNKNLQGPRNDAIQVNYLHPSQISANRNGMLVNSSTSPFVVVDSTRQKELKTSGTQIEANSLKTPIPRAEPKFKNVQTSVNTGKCGVETKIVKEPVRTDIRKLEKSKVLFVNLTPKPDQYQTNQNVSEIPNTQTVMSNATNNNQAFLNEQTIKSYALSTTNDQQLTMLDRSGCNFNNKTTETPVSAKKFYEKPQNDRLKSIVEEKSTDRSEMNGVLNKKTISYYDNIQNANRENQVDDLEFDQFNQDVYNPPLDHTEYSNHPAHNTFLSKAPQFIENVHHTSENTIGKKDQMVQYPTPNVNNQTSTYPVLENKEVSMMIEDYDNCNAKQSSGLKRYNLSTIQEEEDKTVAKTVKTYYDGKRCWSSLAASGSFYDNQNYQLNEGYEQSTDSLDRCNKNGEEPVNVQVKNEHRVKIQLPEESINEKSMMSSKKSSRSCQSCCFKFFIGLILLISFGILGYFIGLDSYAREKFFTSEFWQQF